MEDIGWEDKWMYQAGKILHWQRENSDEKNDDLVLFAQNKVRGRVEQGHLGRGRVGEMGVGVDTMIVGEAVGPW